MAKDRLWGRNFVLVFLAAWGFYLAHQLVLPVLPLFVTQAGGSVLFAGTVNAAYLLLAVLTNLQMPSVLADRDRRPVFLVGLVLLAAGTLVYPLTGTLVAVLLLTVVRGVGWGVATVAGNTTVSEIVPASRRGEGLGYYGLAQTMALLTGTGTGLLLVEQFGFAAAFMAAGFSGAVAVAVAAAMRPVLPNRQLTTPALGMRGAFRDPQLLLPALTFALLTTAYGGVVSFTALYLLETGLGNPAAFFFVSSVANVVARPLAGRLSDRVGAATLVAPGCLLALLGIFALTFAPGPGWPLLAAGLFGVGFGTVVVSTHIILVEGVGAQHRAVGNAMYSTAFNGGIGAGALLLGAVADAAGYTSMFVLAAVSLIASLAIFLLGRKYT